MMKMTNHAKIERMDRIIGILETVGFGEEKEAFWVDATQHYEILTTTGVLLVTNGDKNCLITAFIPSLDKVAALYKSRGVRIPYSYTKIIMSNQQYKNLFE